MKRIIWIILGCFALVSTSWAKTELADTTAAASGVDSEECLAPSWKGTWKGTIGKAPVMMEYDRKVSGETAGKYYYRTSTIDLILKKDVKVANLWQELDPNGKLTGLLTLNCNGNTLTGKWKSPDGKTTQPIQAERIGNFSKTNKAPIYESPVMSYSEPRLNAVRKRVIKRGSIGKHQYEIIGEKNVNSENVEVTGLQLLGDSKGIRIINHTLLNEFLQKFEEAISCITAGRLLGSNSNQLAECGSSDSKVNYWNDDFVVINGSTYDLVSGDREDVSLWLTTPYRMEIWPSSDIGKILSQVYLKHRGEEYGQPDEENEDECLEASSFSVSWPSEEGLSFSSAASHAMAGCNDNFAVPYNALWPYLSTLGQSHAKSFLWDEAQKSNTLNAFQIYLDAFPQGQYASLAKDRIQKLSQTIQPASQQQEHESSHTTQQENSAVHHAYVSAHYVFADNPDLAGEGKIDELIKLRNVKLNGIVTAKVDVKNPMMVRISGKNFEMGKYEVTQEEWRDVMGIDPDYFVKCGDTCPVEMISWDDIQIFLRKLNAKTGNQYRLSTEAEWEFACYGGNQTRYCGSNDIDSVAWYGNNGRPGGNSKQSTHPVGQKQANGYGLYDMSGNVSEWVSDCFNGNCTQRVLRGGSWCNDAYDYLTFREGISPAFRGNCIGFRIARTIP